MVDRDLGEATIVYEDPEDGTVERTLQNEHVAYFQDHWLIRTGEDEQGNDVIRRVPKERVHYVERSVEAFEDEIDTIQNRVQSLADDLRSKLLGGDHEGRRDDQDVHRIDVESGEDVDEQ